jgi:hypothetical protein
LTKHKNPVHSIAPRPCISTVLIAVVLGLLAPLCAAGNSAQASSAGILSGQSDASDPHHTSVHASDHATIGHPSSALASTTIWLPVLASGPWPDPPPFGVQLYKNSVSLVDQIADTGAGWIRIPLKWSQIEPENTQPRYFRWPEDLDEQLAALSSKNVRIILTLEGNPGWAATYAGGPVDLVDMAQLVQFMRAAVAHYGVAPYNVKYWEFYNEPDNGDELYADLGWGYFGNQPEAYVEMLSAVYSPIKDLDPQAQILFGGLAYDRWTNTGGPFVEDFFDKVLESGGAAYFDLMNFHYYPSFRDVWQPYGQGIIGKATYLRRKMAAYDVYKPIICTETGMWSDEANGGSDELQSRYVVQAFARSMAASLQPTIWFQLVDDKALGKHKTGLLDSDLRPKPSYQAYQTAVQQLSAAEYIRTLDSAETGSGEIEAYEFLMDEGMTRIVTAWTNDEELYTLALAAPHVTVVDKFGGETVLSDGDDGAVDGQVQAPVGPSPIYLRHEP